MSYDISLQADVGGPYPISLDILDENYTYNLSKFFRWFLGAGLADFNGLEASSLSDAIERGYQKFSPRDDSPLPTIEFLKEFEPENGWGSVLSALTFLSKVYRACILAPNSRVNVN